MTPARAAAPLAAAALLGGLGGCGDGGPGAAAGGELEPLRAEVEGLRDSLARRIRGDSLVRSVLRDSGHVTVGIRVPFVTRLLLAGTRAYLDDVHLHLRPDVVVQEEDEVKVRIGPIRVTAGRWRVRVVIQSIEARLGADSVELAVADSNRLALAVPVRVREGSGRARVEFEWDASTVASVVCRDFEASETFTGTVAPRTYRLEASLALVPEGDGIVARPEYTGRRLSVHPEPTEASWRKVRELLDRQNSIFRCGLGIDPDGMEALLRRLMREGFRFEFPESILPPIPLPASVHESIDVGERTYVLGLHPVGLRLTPETLWYSVRVEVVAARDGEEDDPAGQPPASPPGSSTPM